MKGQKINRKKAIQPVSTTNDLPLHTPNQRFRLKLLQERSSNQRQRDSLHEPGRFAGYS